MPVIVPPAVVARLSLSVQPLVFETGVEDYPYTTNGTVFLVGYEGKPYVVTTRHGLNADNPPAICVFPSDTSHHLIPLQNVFSVPREAQPEDFMDLAVIEIETSASTNSEVNQAILIDLALACEPEWQRNVSDMEFFVTGYPCERSSISEITQELRTDRVTLFGKYVGESPLPYLHLLKIDDRQNLSSFGGLSGGPVFAWKTSSDQRPKPVLCGMGIRGTASSGLIHFLDISVILDALKVKRTLHEF